MQRTLKVLLSGAVPAALAAGMAGAARADEVQSVMGIAVTQIPTKPPAVPAAAPAPVPIFRGGGGGGRRG